MASIGKIARRSFLIGSAAIVGGVAFGVYKVKQPAPNPLHSDAGQTALTPYVLIDANGVTIITPRAEMGQGVHSTLAALVAEELDVAWEDITTLHGPPGQAYFNQAIMAAALPFKDYAKSEFVHSVGESLGQAGKLMSLQVTGGSSSMVDGYEKMRHAGATAREVLKLAAARRLGVPSAQLRTEGGQVIAPDGTRLSYVELAEEAARIEPPRVGLRDKSQWKYLGKPMPRVDMLAKSTGTATFGIDVRVPGQKFAALRVNPHLGGGMVSYDDSAARAMAGVEKIIPLEHGVAVVASNTWLAMQAVDAIEVDWKTSDNPADTAAVFAVLNAALDGKPNSTMRDDGDADTLPEGATEVTASYTLPYLAHATMEPMNATALYTGAALTVWCGNQAPVMVRKRCADAAGLEPEAVTVHTTFMGGGFGRRGETDYAVYAAQVAVAMQGTPVQLTWSREEDMRHDYYRPGAVARFRGAVKDGKAVLLDGQIAAQSATRQAGARLLGLPMGGPDKGHVEGAFDQPYLIPNYRVRGYLADLDIPVGFWRSVGNSFNGFFHDTFIDELAHAAGRDPMAFRLEMIEPVHAPSAAVLKAVADMSGWTGKTPDGIGRGVGFTYSFGTPVAQVIEVLDEGGTIRINRAWIAADVGTALDPQNVEAQLTGGMIFGLSAAVHGQITFDEGAVEQGNFPEYDALRMHNAPLPQVRILETGAHLSGVGEPGTPPSMPALANALFDLTGTRARSLPLEDQFNLLI
ncbi:xanthine dehydrogenase family protein molybdopterin-binding subunit [Thalassovita taeanensis]|uniref:Isoquinoline 1-oxidoreductase, beta subunit n=1 Tax=Thalassovita taeanensis TaxID=657014 RepID=A0A1H9FJ64_9RHOB|nr:molybdopterin cofactor-binding domain-containing protein [Thalassovita taeanensis]SEQ37927.1 isoquinoline 1-oxidoreductase, beta subunit [Thalassovita taeanensis]